MIVISTCRSASGVEYFFSDGRNLFLDAGAKPRVSNPGAILVAGPNGETVSRPEVDKLDYLVLAP